MSDMYAILFIGYCSYSSNSKNFLLISKQKLEQEKVKINWTKISNNNQTDGRRPNRCCSRHNYS